MSAATDRDLIVDLHLDLAMNALEWNRDLRDPVERIRRSEVGLDDKPDRGRSTVSLPEMRRGGVRLCVATQIARVVGEGSSLPGWHSPEQAWAQSQGQLAWYRAMEEEGQLRQIRDRAGLDSHLDADPGPVGYVLSLEGADSLISMRHLERAWEYGLRAVGPAHYGPGVYANGTDSEDGLPQKGRELLREMERLGMILDVTHLNDRCMREALDLFRGSVWASHSNCRALVPHNRQVPDEIIRELIARDAVIGMPLDAWMMVPGWVRGTSTPHGTGVTLERLVDNAAHICSIAGNAKHVCLGSDLDGGFGTEQCPADLDTIADLGKIDALLAARGFGVDDVAAIRSGNAIRFLRGAW